MQGELRRSSAPLLAILISLCLLIAAPSRAQDAVPERFRDAFVAALRVKSPEARFEITSDGAIVFGPQGENRISLQNAWLRVVAGEDETLVIAQLVDVALSSTVPKYDPQTAFLLVRPTSMIESMLASGAPEDAPLYEPLAGDLVLVLAQDMGDSFVFFPRAEIGATETVLRGAWASAQKHTREAFGDVEVLYAGEGLGFISAREDITASLLMIDEFWDEDVALLVGSAIAVIPLKTLLIIADADDPNAMKQMVDLMPEIEQDPDGLTGYIMIRRAGAWSVLVP